MSVTTIIDGIALTLSDGQATCARLTAHQRKATFADQLCLYTPAEVIDYWGDEQRLAGHLGAKRVVLQSVQCQVFVVHGVVVSLLLSLTVMCSASMSFSSVAPGEGT